MLTTMTMTLLGENNDEDKDENEDSEDDDFFAGDPSAKTLTFCASNGKTTVSQQVNAQRPNQIVHKDEKDYCGTATGSTLAGGSSASPNTRLGSSLGNPYPVRHGHDWPCFA